MLHNGIHSVFFIALLTLVLSACGGGGGGNTNSSQANSSINNSIVNSSVVNAISSANSSVVTSSGAISSFTLTSSSLVSSANSISAVSASNSSLVASSVLSSAPSSSQANQQRLPIDVNARLTPDLFLINTSNLQNSSTFEPRLQNGFFSAPVADFNTNTGALSNVRPGHVVYIKAGKIYKVNLQTASAPVAQQLSSETQAAVQCPSDDEPSINVPNVLTGFPSLDNLSTVIFYKALVGNNCIERAVILSMSAGDNPISLNGLKILSPFIDTLNGRIEGFFATQGSNIGTVNRTLSSFSTLTSFSDKAFVINVSRKSAILSVDNALRRFDFASKQLSSPIITFPSDSALVGLPDDNAYYWSGPQLNQSGASTGNTSIYKITDTSSPVISTLYSTNQPIMFLNALTTSKVVLFQSSGYVTVAKTGGASTALNLPAGSAPLGTNGERVFYALASVPSLNLSKFGSILSNNTSALEYADAWLIGAFGSALGLYDSSSINTYLIAEYANDRTTLAKANISIVDGATGQKSVLLGTLPDVNYTYAATDAFRYGAIAFCNAVDESVTSRCDAYYHTNNAGSLSRLTQYVP